MATQLFRAKCDLCGFITRGYDYKGTAYVYESMHVINHPTHKGSTSVISTARTPLYVWTGQEGRTIEHTFS